MQGIFNSSSVPQGRNCSLYVVKSQPKWSIIEYALPKRHLQYDWVCETSHTCILLKRPVYFKLRGHLKMHSFAGVSCYIMRHQIRCLPNQLSLAFYDTQAYTKQVNASIWGHGVESGLLTCLFCKCSILMVTRLLSSVLRSFIIKLPELCHM